MENQESEHNNDVVKTQWASKLVVIIVLLIVSIVVFTGWQIYEGNYFSKSVESDNPGILYLSLAKSGEKFPQPYTFDVATQELKKEKTPIILSVFKDFSPDGIVQASIGATGEGLKSSSNYDEALQVYLTQDENEDVESENLHQTSPINKITNVNTPFKLDLSVNNDGTVLFSARGDLFSSEQEPEGILSPAENWSIYIVTQNEEPQFLANGLHPKWIDESKFLYMGEGGLYVFDINKKSAIQFFGTPNKVLSNVNIDLSDDGTTIVWNNRNDEDVTIIKIDDWDVEVPQLNFVGSIPTQGFWVTISPDSKVVAVQAVDWDTLTTNPNPRIEFYSLDTLEKAYDDYSLNQFNQTQMFLTDWK